MKVIPIKTQVVTPGSIVLSSLIDSSIKSLGDRSIVVLTSKIVSLCENRVVPIGSTDKEWLVKREADYYIPAASSKYGFTFTITRNTLIPNSGIDESNGDGSYVLWPVNPQKSANGARQYLKEKFKLKNLGVIITDSTYMPLRWGTIGIAIAHSGFRPLNEYIGKLDLFGRPFTVSRAGVASGLAAAAVVTMGEGSERTPIAILEDVPFVEFQNHEPTEKDINELIVAREDDLFSPFLDSVEWKQAKKR